jgi:hypothetical protein
MVQSMTLTCLSGGYSWRSRKEATRYQRQCPRCKHTGLDENKGTGNTQGTSLTTTPPIGPPIAVGPGWPKVVYDLMGISGSSSPENALQRVYELYRRMLPYKYKLGLESPEAVFEYLEKKASEGRRKAAEAEKRLQDMLKSPELIFYETIGTDTAAVDWYEKLRKTGDVKDFLDFVSEIVTKWFEKQGYELDSAKIDSR